MTNKTGANGIVLCIACEKPAQWTAPGKHGPSTLWSSPFVKIATAETNGWIHKACMFELRKKALTAAKRP